MITWKNLYRHSAAKNTHYYADQKDDYYSQDGKASAWQGEGARKLGAIGPVDPEQFQAMLQGNFGAGVQVASSVRKDSQARAALDLTFSAPKSITLQALIGRDPRVIEAHDTAVSEALKFIEKELAQSRIKANGQTFVEKSGNLTIAKFRHETARPTNDVPPDPQLHTHAVIMNLVQRSDGKWVGLGNEKIVKSLHLIDAIYMNCLAKELQKAGYTIRHEKNHVELAHISRSQIEVFSKRLKQVDEYLAVMGLKRSTATKAQKQTANLATRQKKSVELNRDELMERWKEEAKEAGIRFDPKQPELDSPSPGIDHIEPTHAVDGPSGVTSQSPPGERSIGPSDIESPGHSQMPLTGSAPSEIRTEGDGSGLDETTPRNPVARHAIQWSIKHHFERDAIIQEEKLLEGALNHAPGHVSLNELLDEIKHWKANGQLLVGKQHYEDKNRRLEVPRTREAWLHNMVHIDGLSQVQAEQLFDRKVVTGELSPTGPVLTTPRARDTELEILDLEKRGRNALNPVMSIEAAQSAIEGRDLFPGQRSAVEMILSTGNRVVGVQGIAGTGKSHMLMHTKEILESKGYKIVAVASYGSQVRDLRRQGLTASTIASRIEATFKERFLNQLDDKTVVFIDEAGVIPARLMKRFLSTIEKTGAKAVLLGDTEQTKAIEAGRPFEQLQQAGMATRYMKEIVRQKNENLKHAVELASSRQAGKSVSFIESVKTIRNNESRYDAIAHTFVNLTEEERKTTLIVSGTNDSRREINKRTHVMMGLVGKGYEHTLLSRHDSTQAQRRFAKYYDPGLVIQPERDYKCGLKRGEMYTVLAPSSEASGKNVLRVQHMEDKTIVEFSPSRIRKISVYNPIQEELSVGDWVRVTRNDAAKDLTNGERYEVVHVRKDSVTIASNGREVELPADQPLHLDYAYATTVHSAQGLTCDRVLINVETFSRTTKQDVYYVGISRARHEAAIFTDNAALLPESVNRVEDKAASLDIVHVPTQKQNETGLER